MNKTKNTESLKPGWRRVKFGDVVQLSKARCADPLAEGVAAEAARALADDAARTVMVGNEAWFIARTEAANLHLGAHVASHDGKSHKWSNSNWRELNDLKRGAKQR